MQVREFTADDAAAISRLHAATWEDTYIGHVPDSLARIRIARARDRDWVEHAALRTRLAGDVLVLTVEGAVVGFCEYGPTEDDDDDPRRVGHIMRIYVHPLHQARGGGRMLLESACFRLARSGLENVTLWTPEDETNAAHCFYKRLGWTLEDAHNHDDPPDIRYRLRFR